MGKPVWQTALTALSRKVPTHDDVDRIFAEMTAERNDRGVALIAASQVENSLTAFIASWIVPKMSGDDQDRLFDLNGPMGTFSSQIAIAYAFGMIDQRLWKDLDRIRLIRNAFAHAKVPVDFETAEITKACEGFTLDGSIYTDFKHDPKNPRFVFLASTSAAMTSLKVGCHPRREGVAPPKMPIGYRNFRTGAPYAEQSP